MNFVDMFLDYTNDAESPTSYFRWSAYTTLAAVLRNNVYIDLHIAKIYPNMYTLILSQRSSLVKKSTPLKTAKKLLEAVDNTKIISGRTTIAGMINVMTQLKTGKNGNQINGASALLYSEELTSMLIEDHYATDTLTDFYDGHGTWGSHLSSSGSIEVKDICLSMLASSNEELIRSVFDSRALQGGLLARTFLVVESIKRKKNSLMYVVPKENNMSEMINHLQKVAKLTGPMVLTDRARKFYDEWYNSFEPLDENASSTGIEGRIHTHALKLAIVKSVSERFDKVIDRQHIEPAIQECLDLMPNYSTFATGNTGPLEKTGREVIVLLLEAPKYTLPKQKIMWHLWAAGSQMVNQVLESLTEAGNIESYTNQNQDYCIKLTDEFIARLAKKANKVTER